MQALHNTFIFTESLELLERDGKESLCSYRKKFADPA